MKNDKFITLFEELGMSDKEAQVYLASLSLGPSTIMKIAHSANVKRTTVYPLMESLRNKGLVLIELKGLKTLYTAEDPVKLEMVLDQKREKLKSALPDLSAMYNLKGGESFIKYYEGLNGIKSVYESLLTDIKPHQSYSIISNADEWLSTDSDFFMNFTNRRAELARGSDIKIRMLLQDTPSARKLFKEKENNYFIKVKILPKETKLTTNLVIIPKKVVIHQIIPPAMAIVIENRSVIHMHQETFEIIWNSIKD